jgi:hypothetical protein
MREAILHRASSSLNSGGSWYVSLRIRQYRLAHSAGMAVRIPVVSTAQLHPCKIRVIAHWIAINPVPTTKRSSFSFANTRAAMATTTHLIAKCLYPGENADATPKME